MLKHGFLKILPNFHLRIRYTVTFIPCSLYYFPPPHILTFLLILHFVVSQVFLQRESFLWVANVGQRPRTLVTLLYCRCSAVALGVLRYPLVLGFFVVSKNYNSTATAVNFILELQRERNRHQRRPSAWTETIKCHTCLVSCYCYLAVGRTRLVCTTRINTPWRWSVSLVNICEAECEMIKGGCSKK